MEAEYIEIEAEVRYWEDSDINGIEDTDGDLVPFRFGNVWKPVIRLSDGLVLDWPEGTEAKIHYKVCDQGEYWLQDINRDRVGKWYGHYVPDKFLCHGDKGFGDYIIFNVNRNGMIEGWRRPDIDIEDWKTLD